MANKLLVANSERTNYKMFKAKTKWVFASTMALGVAMGAGAVTAHADTTAANANGNNQPAVTTSNDTNGTQSQAQGGNASQNTIATYPHRDIIDNAVNDARTQPGLTVNQQPDQTINTQDHDKAVQQIDDDYNNQAQTLKNAKETVAEGQKEKANHDTYNESHGDTSGLDQKVKEAQGVTGLTVTQDDDKTSTFEASDSDGLKKWASDTQNDYQNEQKALDDAIATQKQKNQTYDTQMAQYQKAKEAFDKTTNGLPTIVENGNTKLVGSTGKAGSLDYYKGVRVVSTQQGTVALDSIGWNSDSQLIGANGKASLNDYQGKLADGKLENFYDITNVIRNNGTITLTNAAVDSYGNKYDLQLSFANTERAKQAYNNPNLPTKVIIGPADDGSIEFDFYGGIEVGGGSINITNLKFLYHGTSTPVNNVTFGTMFSDLDQGQHFTTDMGNVLTYTPNNSEVQISGGEYTSTNLDRDDHGFKSTPLGTGIMVANGNNFHFQFWNADDKHGGSIEKPANSNDKFDVGTQFNIFGKGTTLAQSPTAPFRQTTQTRYHYDKAMVKTPKVPATMAVNYHLDKLNYTPSTQKNYVDNGKVTDNKIYVNGSKISAVMKAKLPYAADFDGTLKSVVEKDDYSQLAKFVNGKASDVKVTDANGADITNDYTINDDGNGILTFTLNDPSKSNGQEVTFAASWDTNQDIPDATALKNTAVLSVNDVNSQPSTVTITTYNSTPHKDVELGDNVEGDTPNSIDGETVADGTVVTYPMTSNDLPANREQNVTSLAWTDPLDDNLTYQSYKAYLPDENGKLTDVTSHVSMTQDGQTLTFKWDNYLIDLANKDKSKAFKKPIIDLVAKVNGKSTVANNQFDEKISFIDNSGNKSDQDHKSNKVTVKTYTATPHKDVELGGDVEGDTANSIAGQLVADGTTVTFPMTSNDLPANRAQDIKSYEDVDPLNTNLTFKGYKAYLPDENGKLTDVTSHISMNQDGQTLTFKWDNYLIGLANQDKSKAFKKPIIDLVATVNGDSVVAENQFDEHIVFTDGHGHDTPEDAKSNKVKVTTPDTPNPLKEDLDDQGKNINGQEVKAGQHITYQLDWDFTKDKGIVSTPELIKKGFFFADPIDTNAVELGDLDKAQVLFNGKKIDGITFKKYTSLSEAPKAFQDEVKANGLEHRFEKGTFVIAQADNPQDFFTKYVTTGATLKVQLPVTVKKGYTGSFSNTAYQFGFGKATPTNTVSNFVKPTPQPSTPQAQPSTPQPQPSAPQPSTPQPQSSTPQPQPSAPQPMTPAQPQQEAQPAPASVVQPVSASPVSPAEPAQPQQTLPQTGNNNETALAGLAAVALAGSLSLAAMGLKKRN